MDTDKKAASYKLSSWDDFIGQEIMKSRLQIYIQAAKMEQRPLEHILFSGPPGIGKTSLAHLIADEVLDDIVSAIMPVKEGFLRRTVINHQGILFLDEIHRGTKKEQEMLLPLLEEGCLISSNGSVTPAAWITVIGATTNPEDIIPPLYDRFHFKPLFEPYTPEEMRKMVANMCSQYELDLGDDILDVIATAANGNPRNARQLVVGARSLRVSKGENPTGEQIIDLCGLTRDGLSEYHLLYLSTLATLGGTAGLSTLSSLLRLHPKVVTDLERVLLQKQCIEYSASGRQLITNGWMTIKKKRLG